MVVVLGTAGNLVPEEESMSRLHIVYATDSRYLPPTLVAAASAIAWASRPWDLVLHVLDCGITDGEWNEFERKLRRKFGGRFGLCRHAIDMSRYDGLKAWHSSRGLYARLELPMILHDVDWCVYADGDTLFCNDPFELERLWDPTVALMGHADDCGAEQAEWHHQRGLPWHSETHVCSGFILMNLAWFRRNDGTSKCFKLLNQFTDIVYPDQDALNIVCDGRIKLLPDEWGKIVYTITDNVKPGCFHYAATPPWGKIDFSRTVPILSTRKIWIMAACKFTDQEPWVLLACSPLTYWLACCKSWMARWAYRVVTRIPVRGLHHRYDAFLRICWSRKVERSFCPLHKSVHP